MQLSTQYEFAFLCMPKCASTSIEDVINQYCNINFSKHPGLKHINAKNFYQYILAYHKKVIPDKKIETFCLFREPIDWVHSWYRFRLRDELKDPKHPNHINYTGNISFSEFVYKLLNQTGEPYLNIGFQRDFIEFDDGRIALDKIFPMERMDIVEEYLTKKIGKQIDIPHKNIAPKQVFELDNKLLKKLEILYNKDIDIYKKIIEELD